jgi:hypothetical protein
MSLLAPLYILGLAAVAAPIVFHLIRRSPRGDVPFSSLMFLAPTPPRLTRRSRLDQLVLLALRAAALSLLAVAFARPFLREAAQLNAGDAAARRIAVLVDTSASMRRGDLWPRAVARAREVIRDCRPSDQLAVFSFDVVSRQVLGFPESMALDPARRHAVALASIDRLAPSWGGTNLGQALVDTVAALEDVQDSSEKSGRMPRSIALISDVAQGSRLDALGDFDWPSDVDLDPKPVTDKGSNAGLQILAESVDADSSSTPTDQTRVGVWNDALSRQDQFELAWVDEKGLGKEKTISVYVPAGESRVVRVPWPRDPSLHRSLQLAGDGQSFDNRLFFATARREDATVVYIGADGAGDQAGLLYYLERVFLDTPRRRVHVRASVPGAVVGWETGDPPPLIVLAAETTVDNIGRLRRYMEGGGTLLYVITAPERAGTLAALAGVPGGNVLEAVVARDVMLGEIAFDHPLFAPFAGAQFNDFTKIHFWKYRRLNDRAVGDARVVARFETRDAAVVEKSSGKGRLIVLASGWQPADSQLARSSKFVPLLTSLLESREPVSDREAHLVLGRVPLPRSTDLDKALVVHKPDGTVVAAPAGAAFFSETDQPGLYSVDTPRGARSFAVNLDPLESKTAALDLASLEQLGCRLASHQPKSLDLERARMMYNVELENRQKIWRWLILAAIGVLIGETWLAGRARSAQSAARAEVLAT